MKLRFTCNVQSLIRHFSDTHVVIIQNPCFTSKIIARPENRRLRYSHFLIGEEECHIYQNRLTWFWQSWNEPILEKKGHSFMTFQKSLQILMKFCPWFLAWCSVWVILGQESLSCDDNNCGFRFFARLVLALGYPHYSHDTNMLLLALFEIMWSLQWEKTHMFK